MLYSLLSLGLVGLLPTMATHTPDGVIRSIQFSAAKADTYEHGTGGGAYNTGTANDITNVISGADFCCGERVSFLTNIVMMPGFSATEYSVQLEYRFDPVNGVGYDAFKDALVNKGLVVNGANNGLDAGFVPQSQNVNVQTLVSQPNGQLVVSANIRGLKLGACTIIRLDIQLGCNNNLLRPPAATLARAFTLDRYGERAINITNIIERGVVSFTRPESVNPCTDRLQGTYQQLGDTHTGCRGDRDSNVERVDYETINRDTLEKCQTSCDRYDSASTRCYGIEFRTATSWMTGYCRLWIKPITGFGYERGARCYQRIAPQNPVEWIQSLDFAAAAPKTYDHKIGGGAWNNGQEGVRLDIMRTLEGRDFCCEDRVSFLAKIVTSSPTLITNYRSSQTFDVQLCFLFDTAATGVSYKDFVAGVVNSGVVVNGQDSGRDSAHLPRVQNLRTDDSSVKVDGIMKVFFNMKGMQLGYSTVVRVDVTLGCTAGSSAGNGPMATFEGLYLLDNKGEAVQKIGAVPPEKSVVLRNSADSKTCAGSSIYNAQGDNTGCRGPKGTNLVDYDYLLRPRATSTDKCKQECDDYTAGTCFGIEYRPASRGFSGYCRIWIAPIGSTAAEPTAQCHRKAGVVIPTLPPNQLVQSVDFAAAAPDSYDHQEGGGAWNTGRPGRDIVSFVSGENYCCDETVTFLAKVVTGAATIAPRGFPGSFDIQLCLLFDTGAGVSYFDFDLAQLNVGLVSNGEDQGRDAAHVPQIQNVRVTGTDVTVDGIIKVFLDMKGMQLGYSTVVRVDVTLGCGDGKNPPTGTGPMASLEGVYLLDQSGVAVQRIEGVIGSRQVPFQRVEAVVGCALPPAELIASADFAAAAPDSYNHLNGGGAWNGGVEGKNKDIVRKMDGKDFCCKDTISFLTRIVTTVPPSARGGEPTFNLQLCFLFDTYVAGISYTEFQNALLNTGRVSNGADDGFDSAFMPRNQYLTIDDTSVVVDGIVKVFVNVKGMKLGYSTVVRVDVTLGCSAGTALGSPLATLEGIYLLNDEGEAINRLTGPWTGTMVDFKNINKVLDCLPAEGYEPQGPNTGCRGVGNSNVENRDYVSVLGADTEGVCRIKCEEHTATCYGYEFKPNARKNLGYCRIWIRDIETTVYQEDATCVIREVPRPPVQKIYLDLGENTACRSPEGSDATTNYETLDAADLAACKARCDASPRPCYGIDFLPAGFRQPNPICKIWIKPIDPQRPGTANKNRCHVKVVGCPSLLTCGGCADRPDCSWQNEQCQTGHCPIQDIGCYTTADSCPVPACVCEEADNCEQCTSSGCVWHGDQCVSDCPELGAGRRLVCVDEFYACPAS